MSRILAIDPGNVESAWIILQDGKIATFAKWHNEELRKSLRNGHFAKCESLVIEQVASFGMAVGESVFETVFWSGRFAEAWSKEFARLKRHEIKMHLCHSMRAKDGNIRQVLIDRYGEQGRKKTPGPTYGISGDVWAALAVAATFYDLITTR